MVINGPLFLHQKFILQNDGKFNIPDTTDNARIMIGIREQYYSLEEIREWIENGRIKESNFHDFPILRMNEMPVVETYIVDSEHRPTGVGEMGVPPIAPAVANAIYAATGKRVRHLPILPEDLID